MILGLLIINLLLSLLLFVLFGWDKGVAKRDRRRLPEATLLLTALLGGWPGALLGAAVFRHKTRKLPFRGRLAVTIVLNLATTAALVKLGSGG